MRQDQPFLTNWFWGNWRNPPVATLTTYNLHLGWKEGVYKRYLLRACHTNSVRRAGCTSGTLCSLASCLHAGDAHQNHFSRPATAFTSLHLWLRLGSHKWTPQPRPLRLQLRYAALLTYGPFSWASQWALLSFIIPKKNNTFWELNKRLVRKPFPIPKISMVLQVLEGFSFATALDLNMSYHTIRLDPDASKICTIIFLCRKYSYKLLSVGIEGSPDIFRGKIPELMESLEYVRAYLDDLLCISRSSLVDHLEKLEEVLRQLCDAGLKVNAENPDSAHFK